MVSLPIKDFTQAEMLSRVARFSELKGFDGGLQDSHAPGCERTLYNVIGFQPPDHEADAINSPVGSDAAQNAAIKISEGFNLGYCHAKPGNGPLMHNHDTNETFIAVTGTWRCSWKYQDGKVDHVDLKPFDVISFPPGIARRFENLTPEAGKQEGLLMFVISGDGPKAEFTDESMEWLSKPDTSAKA
jgi:mannose-6-phosphate isomerase-like protein (cupin superfamily)